jgi:hypothetical protein
MGLGMTLQDYQTGIKTKLEANTFFTPVSDPVIVVAIEDQPGTIDTVQAALDGTIGVAVIIGEPKVQRQEQSRVTITSTCDVIENVNRNRGTGGTGKKASEIALMIWGVLEGASISVEFTALRPSRIEQTAADDGLVIWEVDVDSTSHFYVSS